MTRARRTARDASRAPASDDDLARPRRRRSARSCARRHRMDEPHAVALEERRELRAEAREVSRLELDQLVRSNEVDDVALADRLELVAGARIERLQRRVQRALAQRADRRCGGHRSGFAPVIAYPPSRHGDRDRRPRRGRQVHGGPRGCAPPRLPLPRYGRDVPRGRAGRTRYGDRPRRRTVAGRTRWPRNTDDRRSAPAHARRRRARVAGRRARRRARRHARGAAPVPLRGRHRRRGARRRCSRLARFRAEGLARRRPGRACATAHRRVGRRVRGARPARTRSARCPADDAGARRGYASTRRI